MCPNVEEVSRVFSRSLEELLDPSKRKVEVISRSGMGKMELPIFGAEGHDERIWGLTALILDGFLRNAVVPNGLPGVDFLSSSRGKKL